MAVGGGAGRWGADPIGWSQAGSRICPGSRSLVTMTQTQLSAFRNGWIKALNSEMKVLLLLHVLSSASLWVGFILTNGSSCHLSSPRTTVPIKVTGVLA